MITFTVSQFGQMTLTSNTGVGEVRFVVAQELLDIYENVTLDAEFDEHNERYKLVFTSGSTTSELIDISTKVSKAVALKFMLSFSHPSFSDKRGSLVTNIVSIDNAPTPIDISGKVDKTQKIAGLSLDGDISAEDLRQSLSVHSRSEINAMIVESARRLLLIEDRVQTIEERKLSAIESSIENLNDRVTALENGEPPGP